MLYKSLREDGNDVLTLKTVLFSLPLSRRWWTLNHNLCIYLFWCIFLLAPRNKLAPCCPIFVSDQVIPVCHKYASILY